jgi:hypothetical protein
MKAIMMQTDTGREIYVELSSGITPATKRLGGRRIASGGKATEVIKKLDEVGDAIADVCRTLQDRIHATLGASKPSELTLEFGIKLAGEAGVPLVTKGSVEGTFQVSAKWSFK